MTNQPLPIYDPPEDIVVSHDLAYSIKRLIELVGLEKTKDFINDELSKLTGE